MFGNGTVWGSIYGGALASESSVVFSLLAGQLERAFRRAVIKSTVDDWGADMPDIVVLSSLMVGVGLLFDALAAGLFKSVSFFCKAVVTHRFY